MPINPLNPQPPILQPGKQLPDQQIEQPGHYSPERDADPEPLPDADRDDDLDL